MFKMAFCLFSSVKKPNPPADVTLSQLDNVILVTWSSPLGTHLQISSYVICYQVIPANSKICVVLLANNNRFIINTQGHEGQVFAVTMASRIEDAESDFSNKKYFRAREYSFSGCSGTMTLTLISLFLRYNFSQIPG